MKQRVIPCPKCGAPAIETRGWDDTDIDCQACAARELEESELRREGYHKCPDGKWRRTPSGGGFDGLCGACEADR